MWNFGLSPNFRATVTTGALRGPSKWNVMWLETELYNHNPNIYEFSWLGKERCQSILLVDLTGLTYEQK
jgi:hypothetical protein